MNLPWLKRIHPAHIRQELLWICACVEGCKLSPLCQAIAAMDGVFFHLLRIVSETQPDLALPGEGSGAEDQSPSPYARWISETGCTVGTPVDLLICQRQVSVSQTANSGLVSITMSNSTCPTA